METPAWFNQQYIQEALRAHYQDFTLKVITCEIKSALEKGENYGGILTKIKVAYIQQNAKEMKTDMLIGKTSFESDAFAKVKMQPYNIFNREISIYKNIVPALQNLLNEINDADKLFAKVIHVDYERQALIFEDLSAHNYVMADRVACLDREHIELILRKIAKMHATSAVWNERNAGCLEGYNCGFFNRHTNSYSTFFLGNLLACSRMLSQFPEYKAYSDKLQELHRSYMDIGINCFTPIPEHINVLCHGDLWTNNVMFKYHPSTKKPLDVVLIDFQYSVWGSPALDLHYFFNTSLKEELRLKQLDVSFLKVQPTLSVLI